MTTLFTHQCEYQIKFFVYASMRISNQIFCYTRSITPKRVTSLRGHLRVTQSHLPGNTASFEEM